jgi:LemA protein
MTIWIVLAVVAAVGVYGIILFNQLVRSRQMAAEGWSGIDVQLKRRADLVPNLVSTVKGYAAHERTVMEQATALRNAASQVPQDDVAARAAAEGQLTAAIGKLMALVEAYPDLKANDNFLDLQRQLATIEDEIQMARRYYNGATRNLNALIQSFPSNLVAGAFGFRQREFFQIEYGDRAVPEVTFKGAAP